ncbi:MAG: glycosyltransferase, partial [Aliifodinibius sp.]|nr:glycosyltransferase family 1 protein [Fodinibius sp.]NIV10953.1 glycosyltransferase [Fodinibius sp.]NIY24555.1 glycosyltransferase [Fodinibius sp.]
MANLVLVNSNHSKQSTKHIYNVQAQVCYHGIDSKVFHIKNDCPKQNHILSVGALQPLKGFDFLIESLSLIPSPQRPLVKIIANSVTPGYREFLENLAKEKEVNLLIEIDLPLEALVCQYNKAALLVYVPYNEPFGLVPLEAMACGAPVLGIAEGGVLETVVDGVNGRLLPRDPDQFAVAIQRHLEDPNLGRQLAETGREYVVQNWSWDKAADNMEYYLAQ